MARLPKVTVCGTGAVARATAADLALSGAEVTLFELPTQADNLVPFLEKTGIEMLQGSTSFSGRTGLARLRNITSNPEEAVDVDVIMVAGRAQWHLDVLDNLLPHLKGGQTILFNTGYWGSLRVGQRVKDAGLWDKVTLVETSITPYLCKKGEDLGEHRASVYILSCKRTSRIAAFPGNRIGTACPPLRQLYPKFEFEEMPTVLDTHLAGSGNPSLHIPLTIPIAGFMFDRYRGLHFYGEATLQGERLVDAFDQERLNIAKALGCKKLETTRESLKSKYGYTGDSLASTLRKSRSADSFIRFQSDFLQFEDACFAYVPFVRLGEQIEVPTPATRSMLEVFGIMMGKNYWDLGVGLKELGLEGLSAAQIAEYVREGSAR